jgi:acylphosphatase
MKTLRIIVSGKVQGVFYRATTKEVADKLGIKGIVKNLPDNNVEIKVTGHEEQLQRFIDWCKQGPSRAKVAAVISEEIPTEQFQEFKIIR